MFRTMELWIVTVCIRFDILGAELLCNPFLLVHVVSACAYFPRQCL